MSLVTSYSTHIFWKNTETDHEKQGVVNDVYGPAQTGGIRVNVSADDAKKYDITVVRFGEERSTAASLCAHSVN